MTGTTVPLESAAQLPLRNVVASELRRLILRSELLPGAPVAPPTRSRLSPNGLTRAAAASAPTRGSTAKHGQAHGAWVAGKVEPAAARPCRAGSSPDLA